MRHQQRLRLGLNKLQELREAVAWLVTMAEETLERLGVEDACIHFEARYGSRGPLPIKISLRMGGDEVCDFVKTAWGVDLIENAAHIAPGQYIARS